ncbi:MAG: 16S rRNA (uracil(1498)-N(3))-methyltransferase [Planctomycetaceae bacterium]|nr:16S rRNA (uracil(1498)-N(3))-methyltransferase [Planctomycetaceae bacterium]
MPDRFFYPESLTDSEILLTGTEAHHLIHVMRAQPGSTIELFDGRGHSAPGTVSEVRRKDAVIQLGEVQTSPEPQGFTLATAVPKGDRFRWLIEKATELGITRVQPLSTERSVVSPRETKLKKMEQSVIAACKQSGRNWLMPIDEMVSLEEFLKNVPKATRLIVADPEAKYLPQATELGASSCVAIVGPEGGLTSQELEQIRAAGADLISLGDLILRTETATIALAGWWRLSQSSQ